MSEYDITITKDPTQLTAAADEISLTVEVNPVSMVLMNVGGPKGDKGDPGTAKVRKFNIAPLELPDGVRTAFTVPNTYAAGSLQVSLNGLIEGFIAETTSSVFTFENAPIVSDIIRLSYDVL